MMFRTFFFVLTCAYVLSGCSHAPLITDEKKAINLNLYTQHLKKISTIQQFTLKGRIGLQHTGKGFSGQIEWQHQINRDLLTLYSPFGSQIAIIEKTPQQVTMIDAKGNRLSADDLENLTQKALGWSIPLEGLMDWSLGRPSVATIQQISWDEHGLLRRLSQEDWHIDYQSYVETQSYILPNRLTLRRENLYLKLIIENWSQLNESTQ